MCCDIFANPPSPLKCHILFEWPLIQLKPLNVVTFILSAAYCDHISKISFITDYYAKITSYCYHLDNIISFSPSKSDHIKRFPLSENHPIESKRNLTNVDFKFFWARKVLLAFSTFQPQTRDVVDVNLELKNQILKTFVNYDFNTVGASKWITDN